MTDTNTNIGLTISAKDEAEPALAGAADAVRNLGEATARLSGGAGGGAGFDQVAEGANRAGTGIEEAGRKAGESKGLFSSLGETLSDVGRTMATFAIGNVVFGVAENTAKLFESITEVGEATHKLQLVTGATAEQASGLLAVFERWGLDNEQASASLGIFAKNIQTFGDNSLKADSSAIGFAGAVNRLGLNLKDAHGTALPMVDVLGAVADKFAKLPDGIQKTADAEALFGRSGRDMIEVLDQGSAGIAQAEAVAKQYGLVLSEDNVAAVYKFGQAQRDLSEAEKGFAVQVGSLVLPVLTKFVSAVTSIAEKFNLLVLPVLRGVADYVVSTFGPYVQAGLLIVNNAFTSLSDIASSTLAGVKDFLSGIVDSASSIAGFQDVVNNVKRAVSDLTNWVKGHPLNWRDLWGDVTSAASALATTLVADIGGIGSKLTAGLEAAVKTINWGAIWGSAQDIGSGLISSGLGLGAQVLTWLRGEWAKIDWPSIWRAAGDIGKGILATAGDIGATILTWLKGVWSSIDWGQVWASTKNVGSGVITAAGDILGTVEKWLGDTWGKINWSAVWASAVGIGSGLVSAGLSIATDIGKWLATEWAKINWTVIWQGAQSIGSGAVQTFQSISWVDVANAIRDGINRALQAADFSAVANTIANKSAAQTGQASWWDGIFTAAGTLGAAVTALYEGALRVDYRPVGAAMADGVVSIFSFLLTGGLLGNTGISSTIKNAFNVSTGAVKTNVIDWFQDVFVGIEGAVATILNKVVLDIVSGFWDEFVKQLQSKSVTVAGITISGSQLLNSVGVSSAGSGASAGGQTVTVNQHFYGPANAQLVGYASRDSVLSASRALGTR